MSNQTLPTGSTITFTQQQLSNHNRSIETAERERIIGLLQIGGPIEKIICDYWGDPEFDKDDALALIEKAIKGEHY